MFTKILVPVDWSAPAKSAAKVAIALAKEQKAQIIFAHVQEPMVDLGLSGFAPISTTVIETTQQEIEQLLARTAELAQAQGIGVGTLHESGAVPETLLAIAKREGADLIVMGTHGRSGLARAFIGSVTEAVLRSSPVPVLSINVPATE